MLSASFGAGMSVVEDEVHAVFRCRSNDGIEAARMELWDGGGNRLRTVERQADLHNDGLILKLVMFRSDWAPAAAAMIFKISRVLDSDLMHVPPRDLSQDS